MLLSGQSNDYLHLIFPYTLRAAVRAYPYRTLSMSISFVVTFFSTSSNTWMSYHGESSSLPVSNSSAPSFLTVRCPRAKSQDQSHCMVDDP